MLMALKINLYRISGVQRKVGGKIKDKGVDKEGDDK